MSTEKLSGERLMHVLSALPGELRKLAQERDEAAAENEGLRAKLAQHELRDRATKVAQDMHRKGVRADETLPDLVEDLEKHAAELPVFEAALNMQGPSMSLFGTPGGNAITAESAEARFHAAIMND